MVFFHAGRFFAFFRPPSRGNLRNDRDRVLSERIKLVKFTLDNRFPVLKLFLAFPGGFLFYLALRRVVHPGTCSASSQKPFIFTTNPDLFLFLHEHFLRNT